MRMIVFLALFLYHSKEAVLSLYFFCSSIISFAGSVAYRAMTSMFFSFIIFSSVLLISARVLK